jgi:hypothetical protein
MAADRLLQAPVPLELLMLAETAGAVLFGVAIAFVRIILQLFWPTFLKRPGAPLSLLSFLLLWLRHSRDCSSPFE